MGWIQKAITESRLTNNKGSNGGNGKHSTERGAVWLTQETTHPANKQTRKKDTFMNLTVKIIIIIVIIYYFVLQMTCIYSFLLYH